MRKPSRTKKSRNMTKNRLIPLALVFLTLIVLIILLSCDWQYISDQQKANNFKSSQEIEFLVQKAKLTDKGKTILYASSPQLKDKSSFNATCGKDGDPDVYIAGCHYKIDDNEFIDIYNAGKDATSLQKSYYNYENAKIVTLAHEMMHAVYSRIPQSEKEKIWEELNKIYMSNEELRSEISLYPEDEQMDELYVRVATEIYGISSFLEKHYGEYFKDRRYIAKLYHDNKTQIKNMFAEVDIILQKMEAQKSIYKNATDYYVQRDAINEYNRLVDLYNARIEVYGEVKSKLDSEK
ncbi:hypothetical protein IKG38_01420 [Candidatus Saccharibacteria bacterium]|nr:hypothetical protein [Candidatus Saccharibacteria bacterium]